MPPPPPPGVTPEFWTVFTTLVDHMEAYAVPPVRGLVTSTGWTAQAQPTSQQIASVGPSPYPDSLLMGLYSPTPPVIILFEGPIREVARREGTPLVEKVRAVALHELTQHRFGLNHVAQLHSETGRALRSLASP